MAHRIGLRNGFRVRTQWRCASRDGDRTCGSHGESTGGDSHVYPHLVLCVDLRISIHQRSWLSVSTSSSPASSSSSGLISIFRNVYPIFSLEWRRREHSVVCMRCVHVDYPSYLRMTPTRSGGVTLCRLITSASERRLNFCFVVAAFSTRSSTVRRVS